MIKQKKKDKTIFIDYVKLKGNLVDLLTDP